MTWTIFLALLVLLQSISLQEYQQLEKTKPAMLFEDLDLPTDVEQHPNIQKLVFLTPWNKEGFDLTLKYASKIDFVSPCWYSLKVGSNSQPIFENEHNYDGNYVKALKTLNPRPKLVPRVYVQGSDFAFFQNIGSNRKHFDRAVQMIGRLVVSKQLDGIVWDSPFNFFQKSRSSLNRLIVQFLASLRMALPQQTILLFNMASPIDHINSLQTNSYRTLPIDYLLIQNYDKSGRFLQTIEKALEWKKKLAIPAKLLLMLPFFSVSDKGESVSTKEAMNQIKKTGFASGRISQGMCLMGAKSKKRFYVPCWGYFKEAFRMAEEGRAGVGFWEGGNGLQNYYKFL